MGNEWSITYKDSKFDTDTTLEQILNTDDNNETGYILEVDLTFPQEIHEQLKEFPVCPENTIIKNEWLTDFSKTMNEPPKFKNQVNVVN